MFLLGWKRKIGVKIGATYTYMVKENRTTNLPFPHRMLNVSAQPMTIAAQDTTVSARCTGKRQPHPRDTRLPSTEHSILTISAPQPSIAAQTI